jgi:drug/metabolite transporter (DMT)-like permease
MMLSFASFIGLIGYIGPGAGIGMLGALLGVLLAVGGALLMALAWPLRLLVRRLSAKKAPAEK